MGRRCPAVAGVPGPRVSRASCGRSDTPALSDCSSDHAASPLTWDFGRLRPHARSCQHLGSCPSLVGLRASRGAMAALPLPLAARDAGVDVGDIRQRLAWVLTGLRHQRARESDLIYEAYYEAFRTDRVSTRRNRKAVRAHSPMKVPRAPPRNRAFPRRCRRQSAARSRLVVSGQPGCRGIPFPASGTSDCAIGQDRDDDDLPLTPA